MLVSARWLDEFLSVGGQEPLQGADLARALTSLGLEVEGITSVGHGLDTVVVAQVRAVEAHPTADKLQVVRLDDGSGDVTVVCGARNLPAPGGKVAFARVGTVLPDGRTIEGRAVKGIESRGMICSERELAIGEDDQGILIVPEAWPAGMRLIDAVPAIHDEIVEISVTPNRPDALGHWGIARDLALKLERSFAAHAAGGRREAWQETVLSPNLVTIAAPVRCGRYFGIAIEGVKVGPSPLAVRVRLHRLGQRAINNVVDATNYTLLAYGQPTHAFDLDRLDGRRVVIREAQAQEALQTLDGREILCAPTDLVIADAKRPQALAGVMGGAASMVDAATTRLLLEIAYFEPRGVRTSARRHGYHTDASHRFERGVDHGERLEGAVDCLVARILENAHGKVVARGYAEGERPKQPAIALAPDHVSRLLGIDVAPEVSQRILLGLGVAVDATDPKKWICVPPTGRPDLQRHVDLIEEVMRHRGLHDLPNKHVVPSPGLLPWPRATVLRRQSRLVDILRGQGTHEIISLAFVDETLPAAFVAPACNVARVALVNPLRVQAGYLRHHLLPGMLAALRNNLAHHTRPLRLLEQGRIYRWSNQRGDAEARGIVGRPGDEALPDEPLQVGVLWCAPQQAKSTSESAVGDNAFVMAMANAMLGSLRDLGFVATLRPMSQVRPELHPGVQAQLSVASGEGWRDVGFVGNVHPDVLRDSQIAEVGPVGYAQFELEHLIAWEMPPSVDLPRFPASSRDVSLEMPTALPAFVVMQALRRAALEVGQSSDIKLDAGEASPWSIDVIDEYRGAGLADDRKSLLLRLSYRAPNRSVTDSEVQALHEAVIQQACSVLQVQAGATVHPR